ncbi:MAG: universal stress protein [Bacteroidota bacterium]
MKNILVAIDFGDEEELIVQKAIEIGVKFKSKIWIIHAAAPDPDFVSFDAGPQSVRDDRAKTLHEENKIIGLLTDKVKAEGLDATGLLIQGSTIELILKESEKLKADLIIIGHKKLGFFEKFIKGSVSSGILQNSKIPIMVIPID